MTTRSADDARPGLLLLGGAGPTPLLGNLAARAVRAARERGMRIHLTDQENVLHAAPHPGAGPDACSPVDFERPEECVAWARARVAAGERFDVVLGITEYSQVAAAAVAEAVGAPGNPPHAVRRVRTKDHCRAALAAAGFRQPAFRVCEELAGAAAFMRASGGPWIIKPRDAMGSVGVTRVGGPAELPAAVARLPGSASFLVEEFVAGHEYSVEGVFLGGQPRVLAVTDKETQPPPGFVEVGQVLPAAAAAPVRAEVEREVVAALRALELRFGLFHVEIWLTDRGVVLGEVHVRAGGDWIHLLLAHAIPGLDVYGSIYDDALGRAGGLGAPTAVHGAAVRFFTPRPGRLIRVDGFHQMARHPAVLHAELTVRPGAMVTAVRESRDRAGAVVVGAATAAEARDLARRLAASVHFVTEPDLLRDEPG